MRKGKKKRKKIFDCTKRWVLLTSKSSNLQRSFYFSRSLAFASSKIHLLSPPLLRVSRVSTRPTESFNHVREFMRNGKQNWMRFVAWNEGEREREKKCFVSEKWSIHRWIVRKCGIRRGKRKKTNENVLIERKFFYIY